MNFGWSARLRMLNFVYCFHPPVLTRRHAVSLTKGPVEMRQVIETAIVGDLRDAAAVLVRVAQGFSAGFQPHFQQPVAESLPKLFESEMQCAHRNAKMLRNRGWR